jgi:cytochrome P450
MATAPGPRGLPFLGVLPQLIRDPLTACWNAQSQYGPVVRLPVLKGSVYLLTHPDHVEHVLVRHNSNHWKGRLFRRADFLFGNGLVLNDGESWHQQRRIMQPGFSSPRIGQATPAMVSVIDDLLERWDRRESDEPIELESEMTTLTLDLMATAMLGTRLSASDLATTGRAFGIILQHISLRFATFTFKESTRLPGEARARRALAALDDVVDRIVQAREQSGPRQDDVLTLLLEATNSGQMSRRQLRDEIVTLLFGGYEATAHSLAWTWYLLDRHPEVGDRVRTEAARTDSGDVSGLTYTKNVLDEVLRLYPPFWEVLRSTYDAQQIDGFDVPRDSSVLLVPWVTHRLPEFWTDPLEFQPDRWARGAPTHRYAYFPFAAGQRLCIGRPLALIEMQLAVSMISRRYRLRLAGKDRVRHRAQSTLRSRGGIWMNLDRLRV